MNQRGGEWIRKNCLRVFLHFIPFILFMIVVFALLNIWAVGISNDAPVGWNIFITVAVFGALTWITLVMIYLDKWADRFDIYKKEYREYIGRGKS